MTRYDDNNPQHRKELMDYLTREESNSKGAFRKFVKDSKKTSPIDQRRVGSNYIYDGGGQTEYRGSDTETYLDSPATTSALTYKIQGNPYAGQVRVHSDNNRSRMTLMEIAQ